MTKRTGRRTGPTGLAFVVASALVVIFAAGMAAPAASPAFSLSAGPWPAHVFEEGTVEGKVSDSSEGQLGTVRLTAQTVGDAPGFYVGGRADFGLVSLAGLYGSVKASDPRMTIAGTIEHSDDNEVPGGPFNVPLGSVSRMKASTYHVLAGLDLGPVTVGGGWASLTESVNRRIGGTSFDSETVASGPGWGGYGSFRLTDYLVLAGYGLFTRSADVTASYVTYDPTESGSVSYVETETTGGILTWEARLAYQLADDVSVGVGYRSSHLELDPVTYTADGVDGHFTGALDGGIITDGFFIDSTVRF